MTACAECGETGTRLDPDGRCAWRAGCEHRQMQEAARIAAVDVAIERTLNPLPSWSEALRGFLGVSESPWGFVEGGDVTIDASWTSTGSFDLGRCVECGAPATHTGETWHPSGAHVSGAWCSHHGPFADG